MTIQTIIEPKPTGTSAGALARTNGEGGSTWTLIMIPISDGTRTLSYSGKLLFGSTGAPSAPSECVRRRFADLSDWWHEATDHLSSPDRISIHTAYKRIIDMGKDVLPCIFEDLQTRGGLWYDALRQLTHASPEPPNSAGNVRLIKKAWLEWAKERHYLD